MDFRLFLAAVMSKDWSGKRHICALFMSLLLLLSCNLWAGQCAFLLTETSGEINFSSFDSTVKSLVKKIEITNSLSFNNKTLFPDFEKSLYAIKHILHHALYNTIQHSSKELAEDYKNGSIAQTMIDTHVYADGSNISVMVSNPQIKLFPSSLMGEFRAGDKLEIPDDQRIGFQGWGWAHKEMINDLKDLPQGSSLRWEANGNIVRLTLRIKIR